jgi:hypothetical protein
LTTVATMTATGEQRGRDWMRRWGIVWLIVVAGLALRLAMARGALWLDEAWSVVLVRQVPSFIGVLSQLHHDNNQPLNTWWIQVVGTHAPVLALRSLSIVCSTLTIPLAARFADRRSHLAGIAAAALFACSPILVLIGSEARSYAAALLVQAWLIERLDPMRGPSNRWPPSWALIIAGLIGTFGHLLFLPALFFIATWLVVAGDGARPLRQRLFETLERLLPALVGSFAAVSIIVGRAYAAQGGLTVGDGVPFALADWAEALEDAVIMTVGGTWFGVALLALVLFPPRSPRVDWSQWLLVGLGLPVISLVLRSPSVDISRYYLPCVFALLSLAAIRCTVERIGWLWLAAMLATMAWNDGSLILAQRSEPDLPVTIIAAEEGRSASLMLASPRLSAPIELAAEAKGVALATSIDCTSANYLLADRDWGKDPKHHPKHCGVKWRLIATRAASYRDGAGWALYRRAGLQAPKPVANAPRRAADRAQARAGVAQG